MAQSASALNAKDVAKVPPAIEIYFQVCLFLLIVTGFVTLASTGRLDVPSMVFVLGALIVRGHGLWTRHDYRIPDRVVSYLGLLYILVYLADFYFISANFVEATVHLVLFGMVVKMFSVQRDRDFVYLAMLAFLEVLAAAILTVDSMFLGALSVFLLISVLTFVALEMRRAAINAQRLQSTTLERSGVVRKRRRLKLFSYSLSATGLVLVVFILLFGTGIFFLLPRMSSGGYLGKLAQQSDLVTGFSDTVSLGEIGRIQQSTQVMLHVRLENGQRGPSLRLRGNTLSTFDGKKWFNPPHLVQNLQAAGGMYDLRNYVDANQRLAIGNTRDVVHYRVLMEPIGTNVIFTIPSPAYVFGSFREISADVSQSFINTDKDRPTSTYSGLSNMSEPTLETMQSSTGPVPPEVAKRYLQLPEAGLDPRIPQLARDVTSHARTDLEKAAAIQAYLAKFRYTLELPSEHLKDPIAYFLFERKAGHCEYFASAMAVMLRSLNIPSRVVTGFNGGEFNELTGNYIIRAKDAHSWVEVYLPGVGWVMADPTPSGAPAVPTMWSRMQLYVDAMREFWREWVVNYDFMHQRRLSNVAMNAGTHAYEHFRFWLHRKFAQMIRLAEKSHRAVTTSPKKFGVIGGVVICGMLLLANLPAIIGVARRRNLARNPAKAPRGAAAIWYTKMTSAMARKGHRKRPNDTPDEFVASIRDAKLRRGVAKFTEHYERARFGDSAEDAVKLPEIYEELVSKK